MGPGIPLKAGAYRVRWKGHVQGSPPGSIGHVEVWNGDRLVTRQTVAAAGADPQGVLAHADFTLSAGARRIDYRFWVNGLAPVTLERIELFSVTALPRDR
jgi:hypothetical protein